MLLDCGIMFPDADMLGVDLVLPTVVARAYLRSPMSTDSGGVRCHRGGREVRLQVDGRLVTRRHRAPNTRSGRREAEAAAP